MGSVDSRAICRVEWGQVEISHLLRRSLEATISGTQITSIGTSNMKNFRQTVGLYLLISLAPYVAAAQSGKVVLAAPI